MLWARRVTTARPRYTFPLTFHGISALKATMTSSASSQQAYHLERSVAIAAVTRACSLTSKVFQNLVTADTVTKKDKSPVTVGDYSAQAVVNTVIASHFPNDGIVGEEDSKDLRQEGAASLRSQIFALANEALSIPASECPAVADPAKAASNAWGSQELSEEQLLSAIDRGNSEGGPSGRCWALDPIDGTKGFLRGGQYAVCLAFMVDGEVKVGVIGCPNLPHDASSPKPKEGEFGAAAKRSDLGTLFVAVKGQGAFQRPISPSSSPETPIAMNKISDLSTASFCESVEAGHSSHGTNARIAELLGITAEPVRMDSQAKYVSISRGDGDVYLRLPVGDGSYQEKIWDHAAGALIVDEAGGKVSDIRGRPLDFGVGRTLKNNKGVVASLKDVHDQVIKAVGQALQEEGRGHL